MTIEQINQEYSYFKNFPINTADRMLNTKKPHCNPMDPDWKDSLCSKWWSVDYTGDLTDNQRYALKLKDKLLSFAGEETCFAFPETDEDITKMLERGQIWYADKTNRIQGSVNQCHTNSVAYWLQNKNTVRIATGYALSIDGMWRQHTWCVYDRNNQKYRIVETTEPRVLYYGYVMTDEESNDFCNMILR